MYHSLRVSSSGNNLQVDLCMCTMFSIQDQFRLIYDKLCDDSEVAQKTLQKHAEGAII